MITAVGKQRFVAAAPTVVLAGEEALELGAELLGRGQRRPHSARPGPSPRRHEGVVLLLERAHDLQPPRVARRPGRRCFAVCSPAARSSAAAVARPVLRDGARRRVAARRGTPRCDEVVRVVHGEAAASRPAWPSRNSSSPADVTRDLDAGSPRLVAHSRARPGAVGGHPRRPGVRDRHGDRVDADREPDVVPLRPPRTAAVNRSHWDVRLRGRLSMEEPESLRVLHQAQTSSRRRRRRDSQWSWEKVMMGRRAR